MRTFSKKVLLTGVALLCFSSGGALASSASETEELRQQLQQAIKMIEQQSEQVKSLQVQLSKIEQSKQTEEQKISAIQQDLEAVRAARIQPAAGPASNSELTERVAEIEEQLFVLDDKVGSETLANAFDADRFHIGGFINTALTYVDGEDGSAIGWNRQNFELLIRADLDEQWSAFFAGGWLREGNVGFDDDGDGTLNEAGERRNPDFSIGNANPQIIAWANYKHNDALNVQVGRMITPHGIINIEHFPASLLDQEQPLFLRPFSGQTIFPNFTTGAQLHGKFYNGDDTISYNTYAASAQSAIEETIYGGRLGYEFGEAGVTVGLNFANGSRTEGGNSDYTMYGADLLIDRGPLLWKNEIFVTSEDTGLDDRFAFYTQPAYRFNDQWIGFYRYDYLDDGNSTDNNVPDNAGDVTEHMVGINYLPHPNVRLRLTGTRREYGSTAVFDDATANIFQFSTTYSF